MYNVKKELCFAAVGGKSPILRYSTRDLRLSFYLTNALIFLAIFAVFGYLKYQQWQYQRNLLNVDSSKTNVILIPVYKLGPPLSITGPEGDAMPTTAAAAVSRPNVGTPVPVPDAKAVESTIPTQDVISGQSIFSGQEGTSDKTFVVDTGIPNPDVWIPHEVEPAFIYKPRLEYPEPARIFENQGTAYIKAFIGIDGSVLRIAIEKTSGYAILDSAAVSYITKCKFTPARQQGKPVSVWIGQTITYKLK
jgi:TonB family protein